MKTSHFLLWFPLSLGLANQSFADNVKFDGHLKIEKSEFEESKGTIKLKAKTKRKNNIQARFSWEMESDKADSQLERAQLNHKTENAEGSTYYLIGVDKKELGHNYFNSSKKRKTIERGAVYEVLGELGYTGTSTHLSYKWEANADKQGGLLEHQLSVGENGSKDSEVIYHLHYQSFVHIQSWSMYQKNRIDDQFQNAWLQTLSFWEKWGGNFMQLELFGGYHTILSELEQKKAELNSEATEDIHFIAARFIYTHEFKFDGYKIEPVFETSYIRPNAKEIGGFSHNYLVGLNHKVDDLITSINFETQKNTFRESEKDDYINLGVRFQTAYYF